MKDFVQNDLKYFTQNKGLVDLRKLDFMGFLRGGTIGKKILKWFIL